MLYEIKGYIFLEYNNEIQRLPLKPGNIVAGWPEAFELLEKNGIDHFLIYLKEV